MAKNWRQFPTRNAVLHARAFRGVLYRNEFQSGRQERPGGDVVLGLRDRDFFEIEG